MFDGVPFVLLGFLIANNKESIINGIKGRNSLLIIALFSLLLITAYVENKLFIGSATSGDLFICTPIVCFMTFSIAIIIDRKLPFISDCGRYYSTDIYLYHPLVLMIVRNLYEYAGVDDLSSSYVLLIGAIFLVIVGSLFVAWFKKSVRPAILKGLNLLRDINW